MRPKPYKASNTPHCRGGAERPRAEQMMGSLPLPQDEECVRGERRDLLPSTRTRTPYAQVPKVPSDPGETVAQ